MDRSDLTPILADIAETMDRVRDLDIEGHARAAALQCLADARGHLEHVRPTQVATLPSVPPSATDNQRVRSEASQAFRRSREILKGVLR